MIVQWRHEPSGVVVVYDPQVVDATALVRVPVTAPPGAEAPPYRARFFHHEHRLPLDALAAFAQHLATRPDTP